MNKKTIIIIAISVIVILAIAGLTLFFFKKGNFSDSQTTNKDDSKVIKIYQKISENPVYTFTRTLDDKNSIKTIINEKSAYKDSNLNGSRNQYIVKDGNTYLLMESSKKYFTYQNNDMILSEIINTFEKAKDSAYVTGKEEINGKQYKYEEFLGVDGLAFDTDLMSNDEENAKTRFYFDGNTLKYIKTILGEKEELLKVEISYQAKDGIFEIPSEYKNGITE